MNAAIRNLFLLFLFVLCGPGVFAETNGFIIPSFRSDVNATYAGWEWFTAAAETNNVPDLSGSTTNAVLVQTDPGAVLTGSGNIYNIEGTSRFILRYNGDSSSGEVVLQVRTIGTELDYDSVRLEYQAGGTNVSLAAPRIELDRSAGMGANVSSKWEWNLGGLSIASFFIRLDAAGASLSFDAATLDVRHNAISLVSVPTDFDRWMYPFNATPGTRPSASVFGTTGTNSGVDTRHAQFVVGWTTSNAVPGHLGPANYLVRKARLTLTINRDQAWTYDPTFDTFQTYLSTSDARHVPDGDAGRPVELYGAGFRNGYDALTFPEDGPFLEGEGAIRTRNVFTAAYDTNGVLVDVSNNVGKLDEEAFEVNPFAVGTAANLTPGDLVPDGTRITFEINLGDPWIVSYLQAGLDTGSLRFVVSSLVEPGGQFGSVNYPQFYTRDNLLASDDEIPLLDLEVELTGAAPAQPAVLHIGRTPAGKVRISWPAPDRGSWVLETSSALSGTWTAVDQTAPTENGTVIVEMEAPASTRFFRLRINP